MPATIPTLPVWTTGEIVDAADLQDLNDAIYPQGVVIKASNTTITSRTAMADDPDLFMDLAAHGSYDFECLLAYTNASATVLLVIGFAVTSATLIWVSNALDASVTTSTKGITDQTWRAGSTPTLGGFVSGSNTACVIRGRVVTGGSSDTLNLQTAQSSSSASAVTVKANSELRVWQTTG